MKFNLGDYDLGVLGLGDFILGDLGLGDFNLGDFNLGDFDLIPFISTKPQQKPTSLDSLEHFLDSENKLMKFNITEDQQMLLPTAFPDHQPTTQH